MTPRLLVAGVVNIFLADDAFGPEVIRALEHRPLPPGARVRDYGIRGLDLAYDLLSGCATAVLVDAAPRGHRPGTLTLIEADPPTAPPRPKPTAWTRRRCWPWPPTWATSRCPGSSSWPVNPVSCRATTTSCRG
ncbi:hydrogenase maturation protease [Streptomyces tricolor]|nr:hydrogenase maturation protease [Streptomyces tricolor]